MKAIVVYIIKFQNQISNTNNDAKYIKYENERLDLINKIQYSETKINNLTEEKNSFISKKVS